MNKRIWRKSPFFESGAFWKEIFKNIKKGRDFMGNIRNHQERKGFNVKLPKPSRNKVIWRETLVPIKKEKALT